MSIEKKHQARKRFGQNFLHDQYVIEKIVSTVNPSPEQTIVEIGPGKGAITRLLVNACKELHVVEIDRDLVQRLQTQFASHTNLHIHNVDALRCDFCEFSTDQPIRLVGNLPYNISTPLLFHIMENINCIEDMHFMLQKEVVMRMASPPGSKQYGRLSVMTQYYCEVDPVFDVSPESFSPAPKVDSSIVRLIPHTEHPVAVKDFANFSKLVTQAFSMRRKTLRNAIKHFLTETQIEACDIDPSQRPEVIDMASYARLSNLIPDSE